MPLRASPTKSPTGKGQRFRNTNGEGQGLTILRRRSLHQDGIALGRSLCSGHHLPGQGIVATSRGLDLRHQNRFRVLIAFCQVYHNGLADADLLLGFHLGAGFSIKRWVGLVSGYIRQGNKHVVEGDVPTVFWW